MRIAILTRDSSLYSCKRLYETALARKHFAKIIDPFSCYIYIEKSKKNIYYQNREIEHFDVVIPRISSINSCSIELLRQFEARGSYILNSSLAISYASNKLHTLQLLSNEKKIDIPITSFSHSLECTDDLINIVGGTPLIIKLINGTQGIGVILAETHQSAKSIIDAFRISNTKILIQEYIKEAQGKDIRCLVIGNQVVASMQRSAKKNDFRSNLHRGGKARVIEITKKERYMAIKATNILGLNMAGVDIIRSLRGPLIIEVNASPGLEGIEYVTNINTSDFIFKWLETFLKNN